MGEILFWLVLCIGTWAGLIWLIRQIIREQDRRADESERAWLAEGK